MLGLWKIMRKHVESLFVLFSLAIVATSILQATAATVELPRLDHAQLDVSPLVQGVGGPLTIETQAQVNGTC